MIEERFCFADSLYSEQPNLIHRLAHEAAGETDVITITKSLNTHSNTLMEQRLSVKRLMLIGCWILWPVSIVITNKCMKTLLS